jgi:hypothetical protein
MSRFGPLTAQFYAPSDLSTPLAVGGVSTKQPVGGQSDDHRDAAGGSSLTFIYDSDLVTLSAAGNICWAYKTDSVRDDLGADGVTFCEPFIIRSRVIGPEANQITISGPDLLTELRRWIVYRPLGALTQTNTTLAEAAAAPVTGRTLSATAIAGTDTITPSAVDPADEEKEIRITLDGGGTHVTVIQSITEDNKFVLRDRMVSAATAGNAIELRTRRVRVTNPAPFQVGVEAVVTLNVGSHTTLVAESVTDNNLIALRDALAGAANNGNAIQANDYSAKSTSDVTNVITGHAPGWTVAFEAGTGTERGTRYPGGGESVYDILRSIAEETGEIFRLRSAEFAPMGPKRQVVWRRTHDATGAPGGTLRLVMPAQASMASETASKHRAIMIEKPRHTGEYDPVTRVNPVAGDAKITLFSCSAAALAEAAAEGFDVVTAGQGLYAAPYVKNTALDTAIGTWQRRVTFSEVTVEGDNQGSIREAADRLLWLAVAYLKSHVSTARHIEVSCVSPVGIRPGTTVELYYASPTGEYTLDFTASPLYVQSVKREVSGSGELAGVPVTTLSLSPHSDKPPVHGGARAGGATGRTIGSEVGRRLKAVERAVAKQGGGQLVTLAVGGAGGVVTPGVTDHGLLTGLGDNDHLQYLTGVGNTGLSLAGQIVSLALKTDPGLIISSGLGLGTPSTLTAATTNAVSGTGHTHAITATYDTKSTPGAIIKSDGNGDLTGRIFALDKLISAEVETLSGDITLDPASGKTINDGNLEFTGARSITTSSGALTLAPTQTLAIDPADDVAQINASTTLKTANAASGFLGTGWQVSYAGAADFRSIYADELHVAAFIADTARVKVGSEYITPSMAIISRNFTIPAVSATGTLYVEDAPGLDDLPVFADNDWLLLRIIDRPAGGLNVLNVWGQVTGYSNLTEGEQSWTFTTRSAAAAAVSEATRRGGVALDFGKSGDGWLWLTAIDPAGSPYLGITTWQGSDPYTVSNRTHRLRVGQLSGVTGTNEWGMHTGTGSTFSLFSNLRNEIHGTKLSLYNGDNGLLKVGAIRVQHYRTASDVSNLTPNADHTAINVIAGANAWDGINEFPGSVDYNDYVANVANSSASFYVGLTNPTWGTTTHHVDIDVALKVEALTNDTIRFYCQVFDVDELTPLTSELLVHTATTNTAGTRITLTFAQHDAAATQTQWNAARLRMRWEYAINVADESIRLDPNIPSVAVGTALPTGYSAGGTGFWTGRDTADGLYKLRIGDPSGESLRWDGAALRINNAANESVIIMDSTGSYFAKPMTIGTDGGIWQGTGTFAAPTNGLKIHNASGQGYLSLWNGGTQRVTLRYDRGIEISNNGAYTPSAAITFTNQAGGTVYGSLSAYLTGGNTGASFSIDNGSGVTAGLSLQTIGTATLVLYAGTTALRLNSTYDYAHLTDADFYVEHGAVAVGLASISTAGLQRGAVAMDSNSEHSANMLIFKDTGTVAHGMTSLVGTENYGVMGKSDNSAGGLRIWGLAGGTASSYVGLNLGGFAEDPVTTTATSAVGAIYASAFKKSGTGVTAFGSTENIFVLANNYSATMIVKGNGDIHLDTTLTQNSYDDYDDVSLLRAVDTVQAGRDIDGEYGAWLKYRRDDLERAGLMDGDFVNFTRMQRLLTGAILQLNERIIRLEDTNG